MISGGRRITMAHPHQTAIMARWGGRLAFHCMTVVVTRRRGNDLHMRIAEDVVASQTRERPEVVTCRPSEPIAPDRERAWVSTVDTIDAVRRLRITCRVVRHPGGLGADRCVRLATSAGDSTMVFGRRVHLYLDDLVDHLDNPSLAPRSTPSSTWRLCAARRRLTAASHDLTRSKAFEQHQPGRQRHAKPPVSTVPPLPTISRSYREGRPSWPLSCSLILHDLSVLSSPLTPHAPLNLVAPA
jgi:hypothetical protein